tara:strand:- start:6832 stop:7065 length:234 start_codon:yes stop_codon:yes gene_type:complete
MTEQQIRTAIETYLNLEAEEDQKTLDAALKHLKDPKHHNLLLVAVLSMSNDAMNIIQKYADMVIDDIHPKSIETADK